MGDRKCIGFDRREKDGYNVAEEEAWTAGHISHICYLHQLEEDIEYLLVPLLRKFCVPLSLLLAVGLQVASSTPSRFFYTSPGRWPMGTILG
jgi:hypothetical protein